MPSKRNEIAEGLCIRRAPLLRRCDQLRPGFRVHLAPAVHMRKESQTFACSKLSQLPIGNEEIKRINVIERKRTYFFSHSSVQTRNFCVMYRMYNRFRSSCFSNGVSGLHCWTTQDFSGIEPTSMQLEKAQTKRKMFTGAFCLLNGLCTAAQVTEL